jgi:hypothetical protein
MEGQGDIPQSGARYSARNEFKRHRVRRERERFLALELEALNDFEGLRLEGLKS